MASLAALKPDAGNRAQTSGLWLSAAVALVVALPLLLPPVLPLADLGGHLGRYAVQLDGGRDPALAQWYTFRWLLIPNLGVDLLVQALGPLVGLEPAVRAIVFATAFLQAFGILAVSRVVHGRITPFAVFALPFVYAHSMLYGFLNYTLALGLLWCSLALWIAMSERGAIRRRWLVFAVLATVLWICHLVGWALLCIAAGSQEFIRQYERKGALLPTAVACIGPLSCLLVPWVIKLLTFQPATGSGKSTGWFLMADKFAELFQVFRDQRYVFDLVSLEIVLGIIAWSWFSRRTRIDGGLILAAAITAFCVIVVPHRLLGSYFADQRLIEPTLLFALLATGLPGRDAARPALMLFGVAAAFAGARLTGDTISLLKLGNRSAGNLTVLEALPHHAQMVTFRARSCPPPVQWTIDRWTHLSGYAVARRHAFSNDQWDVPGAQLVHIHNSAAGKFQADDSQIVFESTCYGQEGVATKVSEIPQAIPYLWVIWSGEPKGFGGWQPIARNAKSVLYRRADVAAPR